MNFRKRGAVNPGRRFKGVKEGLLDAVEFAYNRCAVLCSPDGRNELDCDGALKCRPRVWWVPSIPAKDSDLRISRYTAGMFCIAKQKKWIGLKE